MRIRRILLAGDSDALAARPYRIGLPLKAVCQCRQDGVGQGSLGLEVDFIVGPTMVGCAGEFVGNAQFQVFYYGILEADKRLIGKGGIRVAIMRIASGIIGKRNIRAVKTADGRSKAETKIGLERPLDRHGINGINQQRNFRQVRPAPKAERSSPPIVFMELRMTLASSSVANDGRQL